ncbi:MAG: tetratricopeptide repeat protein [Candidatus Latescibacteria bacterium]|nr:tetratricopeptide repeat protein [Candidatus Latescibacterota bacterium]
MSEATRVEALFTAALRLPAAERSGYVEKSSKGDERLRRLVLELLQADAIAEASSPSRDPDGVMLDPVAAERDKPDPHVGRCIGVWKLVRLLAAGGMGRVYLAERTDEYDQCVAVKLIRRGMDTDEILRRFRTERRLLANLEHPHIARFLDAGATDDGLPYLVMEYVEGVPIDRYCAANELTLDERMDLFCDVCSAVHHAHRNLVVHRDLKPANVLVTADGEVKLLDFGIAKALSRDADEATVADLRAMTPRYASPEQIRRDPVTTATDVYSLGVILYELLSGRRPYEVESISQQELERRICDTDPPKPSLAAGPTESPVATAEGGAKVLSRRLAGDLDTIIAKAMHKDPDRRYASAEQLAEDLRRHIAGFPVLARPDALRYRAMKFARRNARGIAAAAVLVLVLFVSTFVSTTLFLRARAAREAAQTQRATAEEITAFLQEMLAGADPFVSSDRDLTMHQVLDAAAERIHAGFVDRPQVAAALHSTVGNAYLHLASYEEARSHLESAVQLRRNAGEGGPDLVEDLRRLARARRETGQLDSSAVLLREAQVVAEGGPGADARMSARCKRDLAAIHREKGDHEAAERLLEEALIAIGTLEDGDKERLAVLNEIGLLRVERGEYEESQRALRDALEIARRVDGARSYQTAQLHNNLAWSLGCAGQFEEALPHNRNAVSIYRDVFDESHPLLTSARASLGMTLHRIGDYDEATAILREVLASDRLRYGPDHPRVGTALANLALTLADAGKLEEAAEMQARAREVYRASFGEDHPWIAITLHNEADVRWTAGEAAEAERLCRKALAMRRRVLRDGHPDLAKSLHLLAEVLVGSGTRSGEAEQCLREAVAIRTKELPEGHPETVSSLLLLGELLRVQKRFEEAENHLLDARRHLDAGRSSERDGPLSQALTALYRAWGKPDAAAKLEDVAESDAGSSR